MAESVRRHVVVHGKVQGVYFRDGLQSEAESQGVAGWVRNRDDGAVEAVLEGESEAVQHVVDFCREGPSRADVDDVEISEEEPEGLNSFNVR